MDKMRGIMETEREKMVLHRLYASTEHRIEKINMQIRVTQLSERMSREEKRERLDRLNAVRNQLAKNVNDRAVAAR